MAPMHTPASQRNSALAGTMSIDAYARRHQLTPREVRQQLGEGLLPFVQIRGQIRVQLEPDDQAAADDRLTSPQ